MRILVTFAVDAEFAPWRKLRSFQKVHTGKMDYFTSEINDAVIDVMLIGIGGKKPWLDVTREIYKSEIQLCVSSGLAGALRPEHVVGEILVAEKVLATQRDISAMSESSLVDCAVALGAKKVSSFYTSDHVIFSAAEKRELGVLADAVEMESFEVLLEGGMFAEKTVAIRAISDAAAEDLPLDFNRAADSSGEISMTRVLAQVVGSPASVPSLVRFAQRSKSAAKALAGFLERYLLAVVGAEFVKSQGTS